MRGSPREETSIRPQRFADKERGIRCDLVFAEILAVVAACHRGQGDVRQPVLDVLVLARRHGALMGRLYLRPPAILAEAFDVLGKLRLDGAVGGAFVLRRHFGTALLSVAGP